MVYPRKNLDRSGQATVEYLVLLLAVVGVVLSVLAVLQDGFSDINFKSGIFKSYSRTYQFGHPNVRGSQEGGPDFHPRATAPDERNFRLFIKTREDS